MQGKTVLVIGDLMLDRFVYGAIHRVSPESDAPVLDQEREQIMPGGAGNVAVNLRSLGVAAHLLAVVGDDEAGGAVAELLAAQGIDCGGLIVAAGRPTTVKTRFSAGSRQLLRVDSETREPVGEREEQRLIERAETLMPDMQAVILSDYAKGVLTDTVIRAVIASALAHGVPVLADPKKSDFRVYAGAYAVTPNRKELSGVTGMAAGSDEQVTAAARRLMQDAGLARLVVTRSEDGMSVFDGDAPPLHLGASAQEVCDVSGAGDTVIATLAAALAAGAGLAEAAVLAGRSAGLAVAKRGTASVTGTELGRVLESGAPAGLSLGTGRGARICGPDDAAVLIRRWQDNGLRVGFTNGCFDILHYGHVTYLNDARDRCDRLVVALNGDASVRLLKGPDRPLHDQDARAAVIGALAAVDMVVFFGAEKAGDDNTPCALIAALRPDIYFKGGDYAIETLPETPVVRAYGGKVEIMPFHDGHSTTATLKKIGTL